MVVATDVDNPLYGPRGAAAVFAPQKGATADQVLAMDEGLRRWSASSPGPASRPAQTVRAREQQAAWGSRPSGC